MGAPAFICSVLPTGQPLGVPCSWNSEHSGAHRGLAGLAVCRAVSVCGGGGAVMPAHTQRCRVDCAMEKAGGPEGAWRASGEQRLKGDKA